MRTTFDSVLPSDLENELVTDTALTQKTAETEPEPMKYPVRVVHRVRLNPNNYLDFCSILREQSGPNLDFVRNWHLVRISYVMIKLTVGELKELLKYEMGPFGEKGFLQFMAGICAKIDKDTGELDIDNEDVKIMDKYRARGHRREIDCIFKRPVNDAMRKFLGE